MENPAIFKNGKPSISIRAIVITMANCNSHKQYVLARKFGIPQNCHFFEGIQWCSSDGHQMEEGAMLTSLEKCNNGAPGLPFKIHGLPGL
jgi:hypothetical protein